MAELVEPLLAPAGVVLQVAVQACASCRRAGSTTSAAGPARARRPGARPGPARCPGSGTAGPWPTRPAGSARTLRPASPRRWTSRSRSHRPARSAPRAAPGPRTASARPPGPSRASARCRPDCPGRHGPGGSRARPPAIPDCCRCPQPPSWLPDEQAESPPLPGARRWPARPRRAGDHLRGAG